MKQLKMVQLSKYLLLFINFISVTFYAAVYLLSTQWITSQQDSYALLGKLVALPLNPNFQFILAVGLFFLLIAVMLYRDYLKVKKKNDFWDKWVVCELILTFLLLYSLHFSYNGFLLLVFADIFYHARDMYAFIDKRYWLFFIFLSFGLLLVTDVNVLSTLIPLPRIDTYIGFLPAYLRISLTFAKNFLNSLNLVVFIISLIFYITYSIAEKHHLEEEVKMVSRVNEELNSYVALTEKITEDRERKRISREIHDTLGHALTGISAGIDAVRVLVDIDPDKAKTQLGHVSEVVREGIVDVRRSLNKLRPDALEGRTLKDALCKMIKEYEDVSALQINFDYKWESADLTVAVEDIIFRVIQESITNSVRHGHATQIAIHLTEGEEYEMVIQDNGVGTTEVQPGYGLMQMRERLAIIGGRVSYHGENGFITTVQIPKNR